MALNALSRFCLEFNFENRWFQTKTFRLPGKSDAVQNGAGGEGGGVRKSREKYLLVTKIKVLLISTRLLLVWNRLQGGCLEVNRIWTLQVIVLSINGQVQLCQNLSPHLLHLNAGLFIMLGTHLWSPFFIPRSSSALFMTAFHITYEEEGTINQWELRLELGKNVEMV